MIKQHGWEFYRSVMLMWDWWGLGAMLRVDAESLVFVAMLGPLHVDFSVFAPGVWTSVD